MNLNPRSTRYEDLAYDEAVIYCFAFGTNTIGFRLHCACPPSLLGVVTAAAIALPGSVLLSLFVTVAVAASGLLPAAFLPPGPFASLLAPALFAAALLTPALVAFFWRLGARRAGPSAAAAAAGPEGAGASWAADSRPRFTPKTGLALALEAAAGSGTARRWNTDGFVPGVTGATAASDPTTGVAGPVSPTSAPGCGGDGMGCFGCRRRCGCGRRGSDSDCCACCCSTCWWSACGCCMCCRNCGGCGFCSCG